jgi:arginine exporter protein ArgO
MKEEMKKRLHYELVETAQNWYDSQLSQLRTISYFSLGVFGISGIIAEFKLLIDKNIYEGILYLFISGMFFIITIFEAYDRSRQYKQIEDRMKEREKLYQELVGDD